MAIESAFDNLERWWQTLQELSAMRRQDEATLRDHAAGKSADPRRQRAAIRHQTEIHHFVSQQDDGTK